jgi:hypothetical protein
MGGQDVTTRGDGLLLSSFDSDDRGVEPLLEDLGVSGQKGDDVRWHGGQRRGGGVNISSLISFNLFKLHE